VTGVLLYTYLIEPFADFAFMRRALVACLALSVAGSTIGVFLILRRMSLMGDALGHALLPGAALGFLLGGLSLPAMSLGGFVAGITTALVSGAIARFTSMREDASFAAAYLTSLAAGVLIVSLRGSAIDLMNILFGAILAVDNQALILIVGTATVTLAGLAAIYRPLVVECFNPGFLAAMGARGALYHSLFLALAVLNMVAAFQALGTLMALGLMLLPAVASSFWAREVWSMTLIAVPVAFLSGAIGLLLSFHAGLPSGPTIVLVTSLFFLGSLLLGSRASVRSRLSRPVHLRG
jgi:zinc/manganese transport system permease protein